MKKLIGRILGSDKVVEKGIEVIDKSFFTKEEKVSGWRDLLKSYEPFKLSQRLVALLVTSVYLMTFIIAVICLITGIWIEGLTTVGRDIATYNHENLSLPFSLIVGFYFAGGTINSFMTRADRKAEKNRKV